MKQTFTLTLLLCICISLTAQNVLFRDISNAVIEVSPLPSFNLSRHLNYLIQYPHGCVEQTTSTAFPQLYVDLMARRYATSGMKAR